MYKHLLAGEWLWCPVRLKAPGQETGSTWQAESQQVAGVALRARRYARRHNGDTIKQG
jgi:hypothetical protein